MHPVCCAIDSNQLIANIYAVVMTLGEQGTFACAVDPQLRAHLRDLIENSILNAAE